MAACELCALPRMHAPLVDSNVGKLSHAQSLKECVVTQFATSLCKRNYDFFKK
jgi:hypothetical protein